MITPLTYPGTLNPARNPIPVVLSTDNVIGIAGVAAELKFGFTSGAVISDQLEIENATESWTFTFRASPDDSGNELSAYVSGSLVTWAQQVIAELQSNYTLSLAYTISLAGVFAGSPTIGLLAKETGTAFDLTVTTTPTGYIFRAQTAGVDEVLRDRFRIIVDVEHEDDYGSDSWERIITTDPTPDDEQEVSIDLAEICRGKLAPDLPAFNQTGISFGNLMRKRFRLRWCESWGDPVQYRTVTVADPFHAILAGIDPVIWPGYVFPKKKKFLSWWPESRQKPVTLDQQEYLYFLLNDPTVTQLQLKAVVTWSDGTTSTVIVLASIPLQNYDITIWPAGIGQLNLEAIQPTKTIDSYTLQLLDGSNAAVSEIRYYVADLHEYPHTRHLIFRNSLGGIETLLLTGTMQAEVEADRITTERILPADYTAEAGQYHQQLERGTVMTKAHSGLMTRQVAEYWQDIILKGEAWEVLEDRFCSIIFKSTKLVIADDLTDLWGIELEFYAAFNHHSFTPHD